MANRAQVDAFVQTPTGMVNPSEWGGNQRVIHFGPLGSRDPYYYFYPKGWDVMYPASFGFFPYRTDKFRGSSPTVCLGAFGAFFSIGGAMMTFFGFTTYYQPEFHSYHPLQIVGPIMLTLGLICLISGCLWWFCELNLFSEHLRHTQPHHVPPRRLLKSVEFKYCRIGAGAPGKLNVHSPYQPPPPPPPVPTVLINAHTEPSMYSPESEMKLYPPTHNRLPGFPSELSLPTPDYTGSPYNTLRSYFGTMERAKTHQRSELQQSQSKNVANEYSAAESRMKRSHYETPNGSERKHRPNDDQRY